ncbi:MAG: FmdE family protein [Methanobacteriaceae archaeon]
MKKQSCKIKPFSEVTEFHGHICPGSALGYKAAELALKKLTADKSSDEELVAIVENDSCAVDAIQVTTGCTFGKGNLIFRDYGKQVYTFINRATKKAIRISLNDSFSIDKIDPSIYHIRRKVHLNKASKEDLAILDNSILNVSDKIIKMPPEKIFNSKFVEVEIPNKAKIFESIKCSECGELVSSHRIIKKDDSKICIPCSKI